MRARIRPGDVSAIARVLVVGTEHSKPTPKSRPKTSHLPLGRISSDLGLHAQPENDKNVKPSNLQAWLLWIGLEGAVARWPCHTTRHAGTHRAVQRVTQRHRTTEEDRESQRKRWVMRIAARGYAPVAQGRED